MYSAAIILAGPAFETVYGADFPARLPPQARLVADPTATEAVLVRRCQWLEDVEVLFTGWGGPRLDEPLLERMPRLQAVFYAAGTIREVVTEAFWDRNIPITTATQVNAIPVAEYAFGAILLSLRQSWSLARYVRDNRSFLQRPAWRRTLPGSAGTKVGVIALGAIGQLVCEHLKRTDVEVLAFDPFADDRLYVELDAKPASLAEIFGECDVVTLHAPLNHDTVGMIDATLLESMKQGATFINTARGAIVNEPEMCEVLTRRPDLQAILDVATDEPPAKSSPLFLLPNVFLTPHIAGPIGAECLRMGRLMLEEFHRFHAGQPLLHVVFRHSRSSLGAATSNF